MQTDKLSRGNVYLMGFMGCGKSLVGKLLSELLGWPFLDTDECIVREAGMSIPEIFERQGEPVFRRLEKSCIARVCKLVGHVISLGGGAVLDPENWERISRSGVTATISYPPEMILSHLETENDRPLLNGTEGNERLRRISDLMAQREPAYRKAELVLHMNTEVPPQRIAETLLVYLKGKT